MTLQEAIDLVNSNGSAEAVVPWRFLPGRDRSAPGSRVDLRCSVCGYRVSGESHQRREDRARRTDFLPQRVLPANRRRSPAGQGPRIPGSDRLCPPRFSMGR